MIWGMKLSPGQESTHHVRSELNLTMASLECRPEWNTGDSPTCAYLLMKTQCYENVICTLERGQTNQQRLDLVLQPGEQVTFKVEGNGLVYLTGYSLKSSSLRDHSVEGSAGVQQFVRPPLLYPPALMNQNTGSIATNPSTLVLLPRYSVINSTPLRGQVVGGATGHLQPTQLPLLNLPLQVGGIGSTNQADNLVTRPQETNQHTTTHVLHGSSECNSVGKNQNVIPVGETTSTGKPSGSLEEHDKLPENHSYVSDGCDKINGDSGADTSSLPTGETQSNVSEGNIHMLDDCDQTNEEFGEGTSFQNKETESNIINEGAIHGSREYVLGEPGAFEDVPHESDDVTDGGGELDDGADDLGDEGVEGDSDIEPGDDDKDCDDGGDIELSDDGNGEPKDGDGEPKDGDGGDAKADKEVPIVSNENIIVVTTKDAVQVESIVGGDCNENELSFQQDQLMEEPRSDQISGGESDGEDDSRDVNTSLDVSNDHDIEVISREPMKDKRPVADQPEVNLTQSHDVCQVNAMESSVTVPSEMPTSTGEAGQDLSEPTATSLQSAEINPDAKQTLYKCQYCERLSENQNEIESHMKSHSATEIQQERKNRCDNSTLKNVRKRSTKTNQNKDEVSDRPFKCKYCDKSFKRKNDLGVHTRVHTVKPSWKCNCCNRYFRSKGKLARHEKFQATLPASLDCDICGKTISTYNSLKRHKIVMHGSDECVSKPFKCQYCGKLFRWKHYWKEHEFNHTDDKLYQCSYCQKTVRGRSSWRQHERSHKKRKKVLYECKVCNKSMLLRSYKEHVKRHKEEPVVALPDFGEGNWPFKCKFCEESFKTVRERSNHQKMHSSTALKCQYCGKIYVQEESFKRHVDSHLGKANPFQCSYCGKTFSCPRNGRRHERSHVREKPFKCQFCDERFKSKPARLSHEGRVHTRVKPFKCQYCTRAYYSNDNLKIHMRIHTGEKPYQCRYCEESFTYHTVRRSHEAKHRVQDKTLPLQTSAGTAVSSE